MVKLYKPKINDLWFKELMLSDEETMSYNLMWGGTIPFPKEEWPAFYHEYVEADPSRGMYRLIFCRSCNDFVGAVSYRKNNETGCYDMEILIEKQPQADRLRHGFPQASSERGSSLRHSFILHGD